MKYWDEFFNRHGFDDGDYPEGVEGYRHVYVTTVNKFAEALGSKQRAHAQDIITMHNTKRIAIRPIDNPTAFGLSETDYDPAMKQAIAMAYGTNPDQWVRVVVKVVDISISEDFDAFVQTSFEIDTE